MAKSIGVDPGTMFFQTAVMNEKNEIQFATARNAFVELQETDDMEDVMKQNAWKYVKEGRKYYIIGEDALKVARMFPGKVELRRPLQDGVLNKDEEKKMLVLAELIGSYVGLAPDKQSVVCTCVSSPSIDGSADSTFHRARLKAMFEKNGWHVKIIEEGLAVVISEKPTIIDAEGKEAPYSGIGYSAGAGRSNIVLAYKGLPVLGMSIAKGGDYIDKKVAEQTGVPISHVISKKEKELDFTKINYDDDVIFALDAYYSELIKSVFTTFSNKFAEVKSQFDAPMDIVVAGGTSMPNGFCQKVSDVIKGLKIPFAIKEIKPASNPRNAVVKGCLMQAMITQKKIEKADSKDLNDILG